ncbi:SDR family oxidoreductase [Nocardioides sp. C4-1]|uniref:SDR family NAD(P)-dependent oxidoreductase n=1 Tax=Nocardioides sp. C4-1 TaxID=3151851 RepID=UPI00326795D0
MDLGLAGCTGVVTGASQGIGRETTWALAREGVRVAAVARGRDALEDLADEVEAAGLARPLVVPADLAERDAGARVREQVVAGLGGVDLLVNNAGQADPPAAELDEDAWRRAFELNFHAKRMLAEQLRPLLAVRGRGRVVNLVGLLEPVGVSAAQAAVAACILWAKGFSRVVAAEGTTVNCLAPGRIDSEQLRRHFPTPASRQAFADAHVPAGRFGTPSEAAAVVVFLCSTAAAYVTGETIAVDGGMHRRA